MLLQLIFITFVVCTAEISEFHAFFLCFSRTLENFSLVSFGACDNFFLPLVVVSLSMSQTRGSCGHLKGSYDNHSSCLNCSGCFRSSCCSVCQLWPDSTWSLVGKHRRFSDRRKMGKTKEEKVKAKKGKDVTSRNSSSSRRGLEQTVARLDPSRSTADGHDDDNASVLMALSLLYTYICYTLLLPFKKLVLVLMITKAWQNSSMAKQPIKSCVSNQSRTCGKA